MNTNQEYLPKHWKDWIIERALKCSNGKSKDFSGSVFRGDIRLKFEDGSTCFFESAFYAEDEEKNELMVGTQRCGYHVFPLHDLDYRYYELSSPYFLWERDG